MDSCETNSVQAIAVAQAKESLSELWSQMQPEEDIDPEYRLSASETWRWRTARRLFRQHPELLAKHSGDMEAITRELFSTEEREMDGVHSDEDEDAMCDATDVMDQNMQDSMTDTLDAVSSFSVKVDDENDVVDIYLGIQQNSSLDEEIKDSDSISSMSMIQDELASEDTSYSRAIQTFNEEQGETDENVSNDRFEETTESME